MKVRLFGFSLQAGHSNTPLQSLYDHLDLRSGEVDDTRANERLIYFSKDADPVFARGLIVTVKDQRRFLKLINESGRLVINVENLKGLDKLMEFNFFVVNKSNGIGLYQHYFQSCSLGVFFEYLADRYRAISQSKVNSAIQKMHEDGTHSKHKEMALRRSHRGGLSAARLLHKEGLASILSMFQRIKSFEYEFAELEAIRSVAQPLSKYVKRRKEVVYFEPKFAVNSIAQAIGKAVNIIRPVTGRVHAEDADGVAVSVQLEDIPESFGERDYDEIAAQLHHLDTAKFASHLAFRQLQEVCDAPEFAHIFHARIKPQDH